MKLFLYKNKTNFKEYSVRLIEKLLQKYLVDDPQLADFVLISICDVTELHDVFKARTLGRPVISGGMISEYPILNEISDFVWHGEIYGFRDCLDRGENIEDMESITSKYKRKLVIDQRINWSENPVIKVGNRAMYYYVSKGCPVRCKYCYIGNVRDYQKIPEGLYRKALSVCGKNMMPIAAYNPYGIPSGANVGETLLKKYVSGEGAEKARMIRSGVEFILPENSKSFAKGVCVEELNESLERSKRENTKMILYFIAGIETQQDIESFFEKVNVDFNIKPAVNVVFTYIDPQPFTPFHDFDVRIKKTIDAKMIYRVVSGRNKRIRIMPLAGPEKSLIRTLIGRCTDVDGYNFVKTLKNKSNDEIMTACERHKPSLLGVSTVDDIRRRGRDSTIPAYWADA